MLSRSEASRPPGTKPFAGERGFPIHPFLTSLRPAHRGMNGCHRNRKKSLDEFLWVLYNENNLNWEEMSLTVTIPVHQTRRDMRGRVTGEHKA